MQMTGVRLVLWMTLVGLMAGVTRAQFTEGPQAFEPLKQDDHLRLRDLREKAPPSGAEDLKLIDKAAKYYANRLTMDDFQRPQTDPKLPISGTLHGFMDEAFRTIVQPQPNEATRQAYMAEYGKALATHLKKVVKNVQPITRVNGARMLAQTAWAGSEEATDVLLDTLKDPAEYDAIKVWALHGFRDLLALKRPTKERETKYLLAISEFLQAKAKVEQAMPLDEENGLRYVRREAVRALGQGRFPAVVEGAKNDPVAWWLLKVACRDGVKPEPSLTERVEAIIGVAQLDPKLAKDYNLDYVAHQIGWAVADFATDYQNRAGLPSPNTGVGFPWKVFVVRLAEALDKFRDSAAGGPSAKMVTEIVNRSKLTLLPIEKGDNPKPNDLETWLTNNPPTSTSLFKDLPQTTIKPANNKGG